MRPFICHCARFFRRQPNIKLLKQKKKNIWKRKNIGEQKEWENEKEKSGFVFINLAWWEKYELAYSVQFLNASRCEPPFLNAEIRKDLTGCYPGLRYSGSASSSEIPWAGNSPELHGNNALNEHKVRQRWKQKEFDPPDRNFSQLWSEIAGLGRVIEDRETMIPRFRPTFAFASINKYINK